VRYLKATAESVDHLIFGLEGRVVHKGISINLDRDGWPKWLGKRLKRGCLLHNRVEDIRYVQTICSLRRAITVPTKTDLTSVTDKLSVPDLEKFEELLYQISEQVSSKDRYHIRSLQIGSEAYDARGDSPVSYTVPKLQLSMRSGPNGTSFFTFPEDRAAIIQQDLTSKLVNYAECYFTGPSEEWIQDQLSPFEDFAASHKETLNTAKQALLHEGGKLKPRLVNIVDSLTQTLLGPLHDDLMSILRSIPDDCTFNHDNISVYAKELHKSGHSFYGFADLANATDRLTKELYVVVGNELREDLGTYWMELLDRDIRVGPSVKQNFKGKTSELPETVKFQVGSPMGALTSWPFMAYIHHCIVWCCFGSRAKARGKYKILGDDILICCPQAYNKYISTLVSLGLQFTNNISTVGFEFAKRIFVRGQEVTGAYTQALWTSMSHPEIFALEWRNLFTRGYTCGFSLPTDFKRFLHVNNRGFKICLDLMKVPSGSEIGEKEIAEWVSDLLGRSLCNIGRGTSVFSDCYVKVFRQISALIIRQSFQKTLYSSKDAARENEEMFRTHFLERSNLCSEIHTSAIEYSLNLYSESQTVKVRYLERDLKNVFLKCNDRLLLRPNLLDIPRKLDFSQRDKYRNLSLFRTNHLKQVIRVLDKSRDNNVTDIRVIQEYGYLNGIISFRPNVYVHG